jgi:hypothetical protein
MKPYTQETSNSSIVRRFSQNIDPTELLWHRDLKNRSIKVLEGSGWKIQLENELPKDMDNIIVPKKVWHRVIKGQSDLVIQIEEWD